MINLMPMSDENFWVIIDGVFLNKLSPSGKLNSLRIKLRNMEPEQINAFDLTLQKKISEAYTSRLWDAAELILDGCGDDTFLDFRVWLISKGKLVFENTLSNPDILVSMLTDEELDQFPEYFELAVLPGVIWSEKKKTNYVDLDSGFQRVMKGSSRPSGESLADEEAVKTAFPNLYEKFRS